MRAMKDSGIEWIGQIPQEWDVRKIKHCFNVYAGATPKSGNSEFWDGDIVWVTPADYTTEQKYVCEGRKSITSKGFESCSTEMIPAGSLIFSKRAPIGLVAINTVDLCTNQGCLSCVPLDKNDVEYFYYALSSFTEQFDLYGSGTTFKEISADAFVNFPIPCPTIETQRNISEYLRNRCAEINALIAAKEKTNALLKERRQSIIYEAVTKGLNPDAPMKDSGIEWIGQIPHDWDMIKLSYLFKVIGSGTTPSTSNSAFYGGEYLWLQTGDLTDGVITETSKTITQTAVDSHSALTLYKKGAIVIAMYGATIGKLGILDIDCYTNQACCAMAEPINADSKFVYYWLMCNKENIVRLSLGGGQPNISQSIVASLRVSLPKNVDEQNKISEYLDAQCAEINALISANEETIQKLKEYRQSIIYEAVTGKLEV